MKKTTILLVASLVSTLFFWVPQAYAATSDSSEDAYTRAPSVAVISGKEYELLDVFKDTNSAINSFVSGHEAYLTKCDELGLPGLCAETAGIYKNRIEELHLSYQEESEVLAFLDILENPVENEVIKQEIICVEMAQIAGDMSSDEAEDEILSLLPNSNPSSPQISIQPFNSGINLELARSYAAQFATTYNANYGYINGADCTNFVSQILNHSGVSMDYKNSTASGWWWLGKTNRSLSWINANTFKNYMGSGYTTRSWTSFVSNVRSGDIIGLDYGADGVVDHCGFVYTTDGTRLRIAQHSSNYLDWNRGWPNYDNSGRYYRIRR